MKKSCSNCGNAPCGSIKCRTAACHTGDPNCFYYYKNWKPKSKSKKKTATEKLERIQIYADSLIDFNILTDSDTIGNQLLELLK